MQFLWPHCCLPRPGPISVWSLPVLTHRRITRAKGMARKNGGKCCSQNKTDSMLPGQKGVCHTGVAAAAMQFA